MSIILGLLIPFVGTTAGAGCVFFLKKQLGPLVKKGLLGFASGVMVAASVWSLLIPAMDMVVDKGKFAFIPAAIGFLLGIGFLLLMDEIVPHLHMGSECAEGIHCNMRKTTMLVLAVTLHNVPEGMAVGVVFAGMLSSEPEITVMGAFALAIGIAIQNFPEGAIISMPLRSEEGLSKKKSFYLRCFVRHCRANFWRNHGADSFLRDACVTLSVVICGGGNDLCCGRGIDS